MVKSTRKSLTGSVITIVISIAMIGMLAADADAHTPNDGMRYCGVSPSGGYQIRAPKATTSCPFAMNTAYAVARYQYRTGAIYKGERFNVRAYSSVTHKTYTMRCAAARGFLHQVDCYGGNGAHMRGVAAG